MLTQIYLNHWLCWWLSRQETPEVSQLNRQHQQVQSGRQANLANAATSANATWGNIKITAAISKR